MSLKSLRRTAAITIVVATLVCAGNEAQAQFKKMFTYIPSEANAIIALDIDALEASPLAIQEKWREQRQRNLQNESGAYGQNVSRVLTGAAVKPLHLESERELTILELKQAPNMTKVADFLGSNVDEIEGHAAVETKGDSYVVRIGEKLAGILHPADRQQVARWLRRRTTTRHNEYLEKAIGRLKNKTQLVAALVMKDVTTASRMRVLIADHEAFEKRQKDVDPVAELLASVEGISFDVQVDKAAAATLRVDFGQSAGILADYKDFMLDILADLGISVNDFKDWNARVSGQSWILQGKLSRQTIDRLMSFADTKFDSKMMGDSSKYPGGEQPEDESAKAARLALSYFHDTEEIIAKVGDYKGANYNMYAIWFRRQAEALEDMPTLGVDKELVDFARNVASSLRNTAASLRKGTSRKVLQQTSVNLSRGGSYGGFYGGTRWGGYGYYRGGGVYNPNAEAAGRARRGTQKRMIGVQQRSQAASDVFSTMDAVSEELAALRGKMTDKYEVQF